MDFMCSYEELQERVEELEKLVAHGSHDFHRTVESDDYWENVFDSLTDIVIVLDRDKNVIRANRKATEQFNTTRANLTGKKCCEIVHREGKPADGCPLLLSEKTLKSHSKEMTEPHLGGTFICTSSLIVGKNSKLKGYCLNLRDVTEQKRLERVAQHNKKLEAISFLAGVVAHEFNNLLMGIQGYTSLMMSETDASQPGHEKLDKIEAHVNRGHELTKQLLGFTTQAKYDVKAINLNKLIKRSVEQFFPSRKKLKIYTRFQKDIWMSDLDEGQIEQVLLNIYLNAWEAMPNGGELNLQTENIQFDGKYAEFFGVPKGEYVKISVTDTGIGMDHETQERIFEPLFTTKGKGVGKGLGLAFSKRTINNHSGVITVYSERGHGTTFNIYLPVSKDKITHASATPHSSDVVKGTETVLLVDDEKMILDVGSQMLEEMGYNVLMAGGGVEAVEVVEDNPDEVDLVILDMVMPGIGGRETYEKLKEINPDIVVLLASGYSVTSEVTNMLKQGCNAFIQKPFNMKQLSWKIREVLDTITPDL